MPYPAIFCVIRIRVRVSLIGRNFHRKPTPSVFYFYLHRRCQKSTIGTNLFQPAWPLLPRDKPICRPAMCHTRHEMLIGTHRLSMSAIMRKPRIIADDKRVPMTNVFQSNWTQTTALPSQSACSESQP
jgi:hypothetical protein